MSKKVKCSECLNHMDWALPRSVGENNYEYAKHCLAMVKNTVVCGQTMKTKSRDHEQYCKHYEYGITPSIENEINRLEKDIEEYENKRL